MTRPGEKMRKTKARFEGTFLVAEPRESQKRNACQKRAKERKRKEKDREKGERREEASWRNDTRGKDRRGTRR